MKINERTLNKAIFNTDIHPHKKIQTHKTTFKQTDKHIKAKKKKREKLPHTHNKKTKAILQAPAADGQRLQQQNVTSCLTCNLRILENCHDTTYWVPRKDNNKERKKTKQPCIYMSILSWLFVPWSTHHSHISNFFQRRSNWVRNTYTQTHTLKHIQRQIPTLMHKTYTRQQKKTHAHTLSHIHNHTLPFKHACTHAHIHTHTECVCVVHTYHKHTYTHTRTLGL